MNRPATAWRDYRGGIIFATRFKPPAQQPVLVRLKSVFPPALRKIVFDPNAWNTNGTTAMDWFVPSLDGRLVAIHFPKTAAKTARCISLILSRARRCRTSFPACSIRPAAAARRGMPMAPAFFTRAIPGPASGRKATGVFISKSGFTNSARRSATTLMNWAGIFRASRKSNWPRATTANGCWPRSPTATAATSPITCAMRFGRVASTHAICRTASKPIKFGQDDALYLLSKNDAPRGKILRLPLDNFDLANASVVVPESRGVVAEFEPSANGLYVADDGRRTFASLVLSQWARFTRRSAGAAGFIGGRAALLAGRRTAVLPTPAISSPPAGMNGNRE